MSLQSQPARARFSRTFALVLAVALATGLLLAALLFAMRVEVLHSGEDRTEALAQVVSEQTSRTLGVLDGQLQIAGLRLDLLAQRGDLDADSGRAVLREQLLDEPFVRSAWVLDGRGEVLFHTEAAGEGGAGAAAALFQAYGRRRRPGSWSGPCRPT